jgi:hypothetical protein
VSIKLHLCSNEWLKVAPHPCWKVQTVRALRTATPAAASDESASALGSEPAVTAVGCQAVAVAWSPSPCNRQRAQWGWARRLRSFRTVYEGQPRPQQRPPSAASAAARHRHPGPVKQPRPRATRPRSLPRRELRCMHPIAPASRRDPRAT